MTEYALALSPQLAQTFRVTTDTVLAAELLTLSDDELADRLLAAGAENPALLIDRPRRLHVAAQPCAGTASETRTEAVADEHPALRLVTDAAPALSDEDRPLALEIAFGLDRRGFLTCSFAELARLTGAAPARVARIIGALRMAGPGGIATSGPRECLIAQLRALEPAPEWRDLAVRLLETALEDLARGRLDAAARLVGAARVDVETAVLEMRRRIRPYPDWNPPGAGTAAPARADLIVDLVGDRPVVRPPEEDALIVRVDRRLRADDPRLARAVREAETWAGRVECRRNTMLAVAQAAVDRQSAAMHLGLAHLRPLTRREVARETGVPESSVSRVVSNRMLQLPDGRIVPLATLFGAALDALSALAELIETASTPLSDRELADAMAAAGHPVARRTVAKYRARLGVPSGPQPTRAGRAKRISLPRVANGLRANSSSQSHVA